MPTNRTRISRTTRRSLEYPTPWEDRPVSLERWERHREHLLASAHPGTRPEEWWAYESPEPQRWSYRPEGTAECLQLYEMGEMTEEEVRALMPFWREHWERAQKHPYHHTGGELLTGDAAREAIYRWAGIPKPLMEQLKAEEIR